MQPFAFGRFVSVVCAIVAGATAAQAKGIIVVTATYTGEITGAHTVDTLGAFGQAGKDLANEAFSLAISEMDPKTTHQTVSQTNVQSSTAVGPNLMTLTIGGVTTSFSGSGFLQNYQTETSFLFYNQYSAYSTIQIPITTNYFYTETVQASMLNGFLLPTAPDYHSYILSGATFPLPPPGNYAGAFTLTPSTNLAPSEELDLGPNVLTVTSVDPPAPAPEPGGWALMIGGLSGLGAALRGRRASLLAPSTRRA